MIRQWAPVVWLAPEEKFLPLGVDEFLHYVHAVDRDSSSSSHRRYYDEHGTGTTSGMTTANDMDDGDTAAAAASVIASAEYNRQPKRRGSMIIPLGEFSKKSYLVTNGEIGECSFFFIKVL